MRLKCQSLHDVEVGHYTTEEEHREVGHYTTEEEHLEVGHYTTEEEHLEVGHYTTEEEYRVCPESTAIKCFIGFDPARTTSLSIVPSGTTSRLRNL